MADNKLLAIGTGLAMGMEKASNNLMNIMKASYEIKQNKELLDLKKKAIEADTSQNAWERDYKLKALNLTGKELSVKEKTAEIANEKTQEELSGIKRVAKLFDLKYGSVLRGEQSIGDMGTMDINTVTGNVRQTSGEQAITDTNGNIIGYRPKGAVFQPAENPTGDQPITDEEGNVVGYRPRGSVFKPKKQNDLGNLFGDEPSANVSTPSEQTTQVIEQLPEGITEEDIAHTMKLHNVTRDEVLKRIKR